MDLSSAIFGSWTFRPEPTVAVVVAGLVYLRGWLAVRRLAPARFEPWRLACFGAGLFTILFAICSPLDAFSPFLLSVHMVQHLLLMMVAPPLLQLGAPFLPLLSGLPRWLTRDVVGPVLSLPTVKRLGHLITHPVVCWLAYVAGTLIWHLPPIYEVTLHSSNWHEAEHAWFLLTGLLFWWPVIQPWPSRPRWPRWAAIPYLLIADFANTGLSAFLSFYDQPLYPSYGAVPRLGDISAVSDQNLAGAIMWVPGSLAFLIPAGLIAYQYFLPKRRGAAVSPRPKGGLERARGVTDLLGGRFSGRLLRSIVTRRVVQTALLLLAVVVIADGFFGPSLAPLNLAGVLPWLHWRGFTILALLLVGNLFCYACPFTFVRDLGRRFLPANRPWPRFLRSKWVAVALLATYLWAYEAFSLWNSPVLTAWIIVGYFVAALAVDGLFRGASFCKYVCPIGQFHFFQSWLSPFEVKVRQPDVCRSCRTHDCLRGNDRQRGCELRLFQPRKQGNQDCTFCLDCVRACPHDNVGLLAVKPGAAVGLDLPGSAVGRVSQRRDLLAIVLLLVFGAYANAAAMADPVALAIQRLRLGFGLLPYPVAILLFYAAGVVILPGLLLGACAALNRAMGLRDLPTVPLVGNFLTALAPLGAAMWAAHLLFHLLAGSHAPIPVWQRFLTDLHLLPTGLPIWAPRSWAFPEALDLEIALLDLGFLMALLCTWRTARRLCGGRLALRAALPWSAVALLLFLTGLWIVFQPMQMRGLLAS